MNDNEPTQAEIEQERDRRGLPDLDADPGFSGLHTRETWDQISGTLFKIEQTAVTLQRQAKRAQLHAGRAGMLRFLTSEDRDTVRGVVEAMGLHMDDYDTRIGELSIYTADSDKWAVASADTQITLHELNLLWDTLDPLVQELGIN